MSSLVRFIPGPVALMTLVALLSSNTQALAARKPSSGNSRTSEKCRDALKKQARSADTENSATTEHDEARIQLAEVVAEHLKETFHVPTSRAQLARMIGVSPQRFARLFPHDEDIFSLLRSHPASAKEMERTQTRLVNEYIKLAREMGVTPTLDELADHVAVTPQQLSTIVRAGGLFESIVALKQEAQSRKPQAFRSIIDRDVFNEEREQALAEALRTKSRYIITTAVAGAPVSKGFLSALLKYAEENDAAVIVFPVNMETTDLDPVLLETPNVHILTSRIWLTPYLNLNHIKLTAKQLDPLTSLDRMRGSQIVGSPQLRTKIIPSTSNDLDPRRLVSTGALTDPNYDGARYISRRTDALAEEVQEVSGMGAYILERTNGRSFEMAQAIGEGVHGDLNGRHIEYIPERQGFMDLNKFYSGEQTSQTVRPEAVVLGDIHVGHTNQQLLEMVRTQILTLRPRRIVLHDLFNGHSVSHHDESRVIGMARKLQNGELDLAAEISDVSTFVNSILALDPEVEVVIVSSNHNDWLQRWLERGGPSLMPQNRALGFYLSAITANGSNGVSALEHVLLRGWGEPYQINGETFDITGQAFPRIVDAGRVRFLAPGDSLRVGREGHGKDGRLVELGHHGHAGANGSRGTLRQFFNSGERIVFGHTHTDARMNWAVNVGTSTDLRQSYNREGLSSWVHSLALVGENGEIQVLTLVDDQWYADDSKEQLSDQNFFYPAYPQVIPNSRTQGWGGQVDQYSSGR